MMALYAALFNLSATAVYTGFFVYSACFISSAKVDVIVNQGYLAKILGHLKLHSGDEKPPRMVIVSNGLLEKAKAIPVLRPLVGGSYDSKTVAISASPDAFKALPVYSNSSSTRQ